MQWISYVDNRFGRKHSYAVNRKLSSYSKEATFMGNCIYCNESAGFLRRKHKDCYRKNQEGVCQVTSLIDKYILSDDQLSSLEQEISSISPSHYLASQQIKNILSSVWENTVDKVLDDGVLTKEEEEKLVRFKEHFNLTQDELNKREGIIRLTKAAVLRDILEGKIPKRVIISDQNPFNLQKNETLIWVFSRTEYLEDRVVKQYAGRSTGVSIRIAKGIYYRTNEFKGYPVIHTEKRSIDIGSLGITNKHIYFVGSSKIFRVNLQKIVSFTPYDDGVGIQKDNATAKPQTFITGDGWFTYNLLCNLPQLF